jgi:hypothetical protein
VSEFPIFLPPSLYARARQDPRFAHHCRPGGLLAPVPIISVPKEEEEKSMSFSLSFAGESKEDALARLAELVDSSAQGPVPDGVQQVVESVINAVPDSGGKFSVSAYGHFHADESGTSNFVVNVSNELAVVSDPSAGINETVPRAE